ncbi:helix-turn-helix domain-containing protein [Nocardia arizonensis]|uniref:helix-turn-helix domain-containing protein n=1 Tax=Nocardia arizonensis TaxID=1141647 RepID=UPI0012E14EF4|nr:helix-turn-helix transcriptional regulator [Nocardia arizonensis]
MSENVGHRIASERKIAGLSQRGLAARAAYSLSMVKAVEQGREPASQGFISAVARVLRIAPEQLTGAPYDDGKPLSDAVNELSVLLTEGRYARASEPGPLAQLEADLSAAQDLYDGTAPGRRSRCFPASSGGCTARCGICPTTTVRAPTRCWPRRTSSPNGRRGAPVT